MMKATKDEAFRSHVEGARNLSPLKVIVLGATAMVCMALTSTNAFANCGLTAGAKGALIKMPVLTQDDSQIADAVPRVGENSSIVGLWHTIYTSGGSVFDENFKQWHSDGTEFENVNHNPAIGAVCVGVWKKIGPGMVRLHHVGWLFNEDGSPSGSFTVDETDKVAATGMSYIGSFTFRTYDVNGNFTGVEVAGTIVGSRITVN